MKDLEIGRLKEVSLSGLLDAADFTNCLTYF
jgi:hypothetical protein